MAIYRGPGGAGDATNDANSQAILATAAATAAAASQAAAAASETSAANSATNAAASASTATTQATNSANSATSASSSAASAASSSTAANTSKVNAQTAETNANASAALAQDWATKTSGTVAGGEYSAKYNAQLAATSATNASSSATAASTGASNASTSATNAASSATSASTSAALAATSATSAAASAASAASSDFTTFQSSGIATGVAYLNGSKVLTTSSALTFDGVTLKSSQGSSGTTAASNGNTIVLENGAAVGMSLLTPDANASRIYFGTASNNRNAFLYSDYNAGSQTFIFGLGNGTTAAVEKMRLTNTGLGLGVAPSTWSTGTALEVGQLGNALYGYANANINLMSGAYFNAGFKYAVSSTAVSYYNQSAGAHRWYIAPSGTAGNAISFTQAMTLDASGNLGIGAISPNARLSVSGASSDVWAGNANDGIAINGAATANAVSTVSTYLDTSSLRIGAGVTQKTGILITGQSSGSGSTVQFSTGGSERMRIDSSGNVGIGTSSPSALTHISANEITAYNGTATDGQLTAGSTLFIGQTGGSNTAISQLVFQPRTGYPYNRIVSSGGSAPYMTLVTNNAERMRIDSSGNVLVGTTTQATGAALTVNGSIKGTITSGTSVTASGTSVDFTGIPSWVKRITIMLKSVSTTGTTGNIGIRIGDSGGFATTGYEDGWVNQAGTVTSGTTYFAVVTPAAASDQISAVATIVNISGNIWVCNRQTYRNSGTPGFVNGVGNKTLTNTLDRVQVVISATDSFDAGTINIFYEG